MTRPVFVDAAAAHAVAGAGLRLGAEVSHHAVTVRKLRVGEGLDIVDGTGLRARAVLAEASPTSALVDVVSVEVEPEPRPGLVLVQALAKQGRDLQAVETATEVGVDEIRPWAARRSIAAWPAAKAAKMSQKWENTVHAAAIQARRSRVPVVGELLEGTGAAGILTERDLCLVLHEEATASLPEVFASAGLMRLHGTDEAGAASAGGTHGEPSSPVYDRVVLCVGPEGGITPEEIEAFTARGATAVRLGPEILKAANAGPVGLAACQLLLGRWS